MKTFSQKSFVLIASLFVATACINGTLPAQDAGLTDTDDESNRYDSGPGEPDDPDTSEGSVPDIDRGLDAAETGLGSDAADSSTSGDTSGASDASDGETDGSTGGCRDGATRSCGNSTGVCQPGTETCRNGSWGACQGATMGSSETCDQKDNDCDGTVDENCDCTSGSTRNCGSSTGVCTQGTQTCTSGTWSMCQGETTGRTEVCDGKDNDCDGSVDENLTRACGDSTGVCSPGTETCTNGQWGSCQGNTGPSNETCDDKDNDCDGSTDEDCDQDNDDYCDDGRIVVGSPSTCSKGGGDCDDSDSSVHPGASGNCDGKDNDCDGKVDEIQPVVGKSKAVTHKASRNSATSYKIKTAVATPTDEGVCAAFLDDNGSLQFAHIKRDGTVTRKNVTISGSNPKELFDIAASGKNCAVLYRRKVSFTPDDDLYLARWNTNSRNVFHQVQLTSNTYNSEFEGHAAVEYISGTGWVASYVETTIGLDKVHFATLPDFFKGSATPKQTQITKVDVAGAGPWPSIAIGESANPSDDFAVAISSRWNNQYQIRVYVVNGTNTRSASKLRMPFYPGDERLHLGLDEVDGDHVLSYHNSSLNKRYLYEIDTRFSSGSLYLDYDLTGKTDSKARTQILPTNLAAGSSSTGQWFLEPFKDEVSTFDVSGSNITFSAQSHPLYSSTDDLRTLYADEKDHLLYVFSLVNKRPYKSEMNAFACY